MKRIVLVLTIILIGIGLFGFYNSPDDPQTNDGIRFFSGTFQQALDQAKKENKLVFLDAYASWCGPCKWMKNKTFTNKAVGEFYNRHFINIAIDMEKGEGPSLANKFAVDAYPTLIYLTAEGKLIGKTTGYHRPKDFISVGEQIASIK